MTAKQKLADIATRLEIEITDSDLADMRELSTTARKLCDLRYCHSDTASALAHDRVLGLIMRNFPPDTDVDFEEFADCLLSVADNKYGSIYGSDTVEFGFHTMRQRSR